MLDFEIIIYTKSMKGNIWSWTVSIVVKVTICRNRLMPLPHYGKGITLDDHTTFSFCNLIFSTAHICCREIQHTMLRDWKSKWIQPLNDFCFCCFTKYWKTYVYWKRVSLPVRWQNMFPFFLRDCLKQISCDIWEMVE